jgi:hypothetical protein
MPCLLACLLGVLGVHNCVVWDLASLLESPVCVLLISVVLPCGRLLWLADRLVCGRLL